jgi:proliferating cell nuclear antigen
MKLVLQENKYLKEPIFIISELVNEATFKIDKDKIELIAMDPGNVAMVIFKLLSTAFVEYKIDEPLELTVNLDNLKQILKRASSEDIITLELLNNKIKIELKSKSKRTFNLALINSEYSAKKVPDLKFVSKVETNNSLFNEAIEDADIVSDSVSFIVDKDKFTIEAFGSLTNASIDLNQGEQTKIQTEDKVISRYSIEYLKKFIKASKLADDVVLQFGKDYPLKLSYKILDKMLMEFILAPRFQNE